MMLDSSLGKVFRGVELSVLSSALAGSWLSIDVKGVSIGEREESEPVCCLLSSLVPWELSGGVTRAVWRAGLVGWVVGALPASRDDTSRMESEIRSRDSSTRSGTDIPPRILRTGM